MKYEIRAIRGHYEIYDMFGNFTCSADTYEEAKNDIELLSFTE